MTGSYGTRARSSQHPLQLVVWSTLLGYRDFVPLPSSSPPRLSLPYPSQPHHEFHEPSSSQNPTEPRSRCSMNRSFNRPVPGRHSAVFERTKLPETSRSPVPAPVSLSPGPLFSPGFTRPVHGGIRTTRTYPARIISSSRLLAIGNNRGHISPTSSLVHGW